MTRVPKGKDVEEVKASRGGRPLRPSRLKAAGYTYLGGSARKWKAPDGRILSRRAAYKEIGIPMLSAKDWERIDAKEGRERAKAIEKAGFKLQRPRELY
jgi:hypothetical protein